MENGKWSVEKGAGGQLDHDVWAGRMKTFGSGTQYQFA